MGAQIINFELRVCPASSNASMADTINTNYWRRISDAIAGKHAAGVNQAVARFLESIRKSSREGGK